MRHFRTPLALALVAFLCWSVFVHHLYRMALADDEASAQDREPCSKAVSPPRRTSPSAAGRPVSAGSTPRFPMQLLPNPYLEVPNRDVVTESGQRLTLVNPAYMTRMVHELMAEEAGLKGHITSLDPIRPENAPADWEARALRAFRNASDEMHALAVEDGRRVLRYMRPLV